MTLLGHQISLWRDMARAKQTIHAMLGLTHVFSIFWLIFSQSPRANEFVYLVFTCSSVVQIVRRQNAVQIHIKQIGTFFRMSPYILAEFGHFKLDILS